MEFINIYIYIYIYIYTHTHTHYGRGARRRRAGPRVHDIRGRALRVTVWAEPSDTSWP